MHVSHVETLVQRSVVNVREAAEEGFRRVITFQTGGHHKRKHPNTPKVPPLLSKGGENPNHLKFSNTFSVGSAQGESKETIAWPSQYAAQQSGPIRTRIFFVTVNTTQLKDDDISSSSRGRKDGRYADTHRERGKGGGLVDSVLKEALV